MKIPVNFNGQRFGRLVVTGLDGVRRNTHWKCRCDCGTECIVVGYNLRGGHTQSCGCWARERSPLIERLIDSYSPEPMSGCWLWTKSLDTKGYAQITTGSNYDSSRRLKRAHRVAYEELIGPIPVGLQLDHKCRVRSCVNPNHLEPVTQRVNLLRGEGTSAKNAVKTHCKRGHEFVPDNTYVFRGKRQCKECKYYSNLSRLRAASLSAGQRERKSARNYSSLNQESAQSVGVRWNGLGVL